MDESPLQAAADRVGKAILLGTRFRRDDVALLHSEVLRQLEEDEDRRGLMAMQMRTETWQNADAAPTPDGVVDLMAELEASVAAAKAGRLRTAPVAGAGEGADHD